MQHNHAHPDMCSCLTVCAPCLRVPSALLLAARNAITQPFGTQVLPNAREPLHKQYAEAQRRLGLAQAESRAAKAASETSDLECQRMRQQMEQAARQADAVAAQLRACQQEVAAKEEALACRALEVRACACVGKGWR